MLILEYRIIGIPDVGSPLEELSKSSSHRFQMCVSIT